MQKISVGSICSGIEGASVALNHSDYKFEWFSEISPFPSKILSQKYPKVSNLGDMCHISDLIMTEQISAPDLICGGTPCQAFSLAGWKQGLSDDRGNLTLKFVDIIRKNDIVRANNGKPPTIILWENVEGVLRDKTNAFGCFLSSLIGSSSELKNVKWPQSGLIRGSSRTVAWRVLDSKYFGLPQQRRRLYVVSGGSDFFPENILFDQFPSKLKEYDLKNLCFQKNKNEIEIFRNYTDCLYSAYGTKWNGNAAAYNGSLFVSQNHRLRRLTPLECERLMGFPDNYTNHTDAKPTNRFQALGNSWAVPVIRWIGKRLVSELNNPHGSNLAEPEILKSAINGMDLDSHFYEIPLKHDANQRNLFTTNLLNGSVIPELPSLGNMFDIIDTDAHERFYISPVGCMGILRRAKERSININKSLQNTLIEVSGNMTDAEIEKRSRVQSRGRYSS